MTDEEYVRNLGKLYNKVLSLRSNDDYIINQPQMDKLVEVLNFFIDAAKECGGKIEPMNLEPRAEHGGVTATFLVFDIHGEKIQEFCKAISYTSAMTIDATNDGICISVTVPNVFKPIEE